MPTIKKRKSLIVVFAGLGVVVFASLAYLYWTQTIALRQYNLLAASSNGDVLEVKRLLKEGVDINARFGGDGETSLHRAASAGRVEVARVLLDAGANPNATTSEGATPLLEASYKGYVDIAKLLLERGANVNAAEKRHGFTPLQEAIRKGNVELVKLLLDGGADMHSKTIDGRDAFARAAASGDERIQELLKAKAKQ